MKIDKLLEFLDEDEKDALYFVLCERKMKQSKAAGEALRLNAYEEKLIENNESLVPAIMEIRRRFNCELTVAKYAAEKYRDRVKGK